MLGLFISMLPWHVLVAWIVIFLTGTVIPLYLGVLISRTSGLPFNPVVMTLQALLGAAALLLLHYRLRTRSFILS